MIYIRLKHLLTDGLLFNNDISKLILSVDRFYYHFKILTYFGHFKPQPKNSLWKQIRLKFFEDSRENSSSYQNVYCFKVGQSKRQVNPTFDIGQDDAEQNGEGLLQHYYKIVLVKCGRKFIVVSRNSISQEIRNMLNIFAT